MSAHASVTIHSTRGPAEQAGGSGQCDVDGAGVGEEDPLPPVVEVVSQGQERGGQEEARGHERRARPARREPGEAHQHDRQRARRLVRARGDRQASQESRLSTRPRTERPATSKGNRNSSAVQVTGSESGARMSRVTEFELTSIRSSRPRTRMHAVRAAERRWRGVSRATLQRTPKSKAPKPAAKTRRSPSPRSRRCPNRT